MEWADRLRPEDGLRLNRRLLSNFPRAPLSLAILLGLSLVLGVIIVAQAWVLSQAVTAVFLPSQPPADTTHWLWLLVLLACMRGAALWLRGSWAGHVSSKAQMQLRQQAMEGLIREDPAIFRRHPVGEWTASLVGGVESLDSYFRHYLPALGSAVIVPLAILVAVFPLDLLSGFILLLTAPLVPFFMLLIGRTANQQLRSRWQALRSMSGHFLEVVQGLPTLRLLGRSQAESERIRAISDRFRLSTLQVLRVAFLSALVLEWAAMLSTAVIAVEIALRLLSFNLTFQTAFFILLLTPEFFLPLRALGARFHDAAGGMTGAETALTLASVAKQPRPIRAERSPRLGPYDAPVEVRFSRVSYAYPGRDQLALDDVSFTLRPGERLLVLGPSGAGKTTLAWLLLGLLAPSAGAVLIAGLPVRRPTGERARHEVAWVSQRPYLFAGTIADNLRFALPGATDDELVQALSLADLSDFIHRLPAGLETDIGERAVRLSAGQAQRLALARAYLVDAPVLLLDEPTAHLDWRAEQSFYQALDRLMQGRTTVMISHHMGHLLKSDRLLILDHGHVRACGSPGQVLDLPELSPPVPATLGPIRHE